jgi:hypothetical protein
MKTETVKKQTAIDLAGGVGKLAEILGVTSSAVSLWGEDLPEGRYWKLRTLRPHWFTPIVSLNILNFPADKRAEIAASAQKAADTQVHIDAANPYPAGTPESKKFVIEYWASVRDVVGE